MLLVAAPMAPVVTITGAAAAGNTCSTGLPGAGTDSNPYEVSSASHLQCIGSQDLDAEYELTADVDLAGVNFDPIGDDESPFTGTFHGNGHTIDNLAVSEPSKDGVGLFGVSTGRIEDVTLTNVTVEGADDVGGVAGEQSGHVDDVVVTGRVTGTDDVGGLVGEYDGVTNIDISRSSAAVDVDGDTDVGGLVGFNANAGGAITDSSANGSVTGTSNVGGLVGRAEAYSDTTGIHSSYAEGSVEATGSTGNAGGLVGNSAGGRVVESYATGDVSGPENVGGLVGRQDHNDNGNGAGVRDSYATGDVTGGNTVGGLVGYSDGGIDTSYATGAVSGSTTGGLVGENDATVEDSYWDTGTTGQSDGTGTGSLGSSNAALTTAEMQGTNARANMGGFLFPDRYNDGPWVIRSGDYPALAWQPVPPIVSGVAVTNPSGQTVSISFDSSRKVDPIAVTLSGPGLTKTLTSYDFEETAPFRGPLTYTLADRIDTGANGTYTVTVDTATSEAGLDGASGQSDTVTIGPAGGPTANFSYSPASPQPGETVTFDATNASDGDGSIVGYDWDLDGDGTTDATGQTLAHSFDTSGAQDVTLTVTEDDGTTNSTTETVSVSADDGPTAAFDWDPTTPKKGVPVTFNASNSTDPDGSIADYTWEVEGEGTFDTGEDWFLVFDDAGTYNVTLTVTDNSGNTNETTRTVEIDPDESDSAGGAGGGSGGGAGGGDGGDDTSTATPTPSPTPTATPAPTPTATPTSSPTPSATPTSSPTGTPTPTQTATTTQAATGAPPATATASPTAGGTQTATSDDGSTASTASPPEAQTQAGTAAEDDPRATTADSGPGFGLGAGLVALVLIALAYRQRD